MKKKKTFNECIMDLLTKLFTIHLIYKADFLHQYVFLGVREPDIVSVWCNIAINFPDGYIQIRITFHFLLIRTLVFNCLHASKFFKRYSIPISMKTVVEMLPHLSYVTV